MTAPDVAYCSRCGSPVEQRLSFGRQRPTCLACGRIHFIDPKVAAGVLVVRDNQVLLVRRAIEPQLGRWTLPAGFVDAGEDVRAAAVRECEEETGLQVRIEAVLDVYSGREHPNGADIVIVFLATPRAGRLTPGDDAAEVGFFAADALPELAFEATRRSLEAWRASAGAG